MILDADDVSYAPDNVAGGVAIGPGSPYKNALPAIRELVAYIQNLNIPSSQTADEIATALAADASAMATLQNAIEILADMFYAESNMNIPYTFEDVTDWVTAAAGNPATSLTTISAIDIDDDATFGPEWEQDSQTSSVTVYQRTAFRPRRGRVYRVTVKGYVGGSNSCTLQAVVAQLNSSYAVTTANKASTQNTTFTAANTLQTVTFTMSIDNVDADVDLDDVPFIRVGATLGPDTATSTNLRITEIHVEDVTEPFLNLDAATIVAAILASATSLESLKDGIVADFDANDIQAIVADLDADATSEQNLATALAGNATAMGTLGAGFSGDIDAGAFSANAVALADMAQLAEARVLGRADGAGIGDVTSLTGAQVATIADAATLTGTQTLTNKTLTAPVLNGSLTGTGILDEDDMSSDSATAIPTQQSVKAYVDGRNTLATAQATTSGTSKSFTGLPAGINWIDVVPNGVSLDGATDDVLVQIGDSGGLETTGYTAGSTVGAGTDTSTAGFIIALQSATAALHGIMHLRRVSGNTWTASHDIHRTGSNAAHGGGSKTLSAELTQIAILSSGSDAFDAGSVTIAYGY